MTEKAAGKMIKMAIKKSDELYNVTFNVLYGKKLSAKYKDWYLSDIYDHTKFYKLLIEGQTQKAAKFMRGLDTASRDMIPDYIYNVLNNQNGRP